MKSYQTVNTFVCIVSIGFAGAILDQQTYASDHHDGPRVLGGPAFDITDMFAFPSPERPGHLVLIVNTMPLASDSAWFSDALAYDFVIRRASIGKTGPAAAFTIDNEEVRLSCRFEEPKARGSKLMQRGTCRSSTGVTVPVVVGDENSTSTSGLRVFAGLRSDPFYLNVGRIMHVELGATSGAKNSLQDKNVLGIAIEVDMEKVLGYEQGNLYAVVAEVYAAGKLPVRLDRMGRSEMTNITLSVKQFDEVNRDLEIRDLYNQQDSFNLSEDYVGAFRARFNANLAFWDKLDQLIDWPLHETQHPLTELLLQDLLIVDPAKPRADYTFFEIEKAMLNDRPHATCGGRFPNEDTVDTLLSLYVNGGTRDRIGDGVSKPTRMAPDVFPYLAQPTRPQEGK